LRQFVHFRIHVELLRSEGDAGAAMKTIGLIGGMSWESSIEYYRIINEAVRERLGGLHSAKCLMYSVDFAEIEPLQHGGKWTAAAERMIEAARHVEDGGADFLVLCTNTMHRTADEIEKHTRIPLLHIADATAQPIKAQGLARVGLLGTRFTMEDDFYKGRLTEKHSLDVVIPTEEDRETVHRVIYDELCLGKIRQTSKEQYGNVIENLVHQGAQGIILGCTEISLLVGVEDSPVPVFDTTRIHAQAAVEYALPSLAAGRPAVCPVRRSIGTRERSRVGDAAAQTDP
jgi:aspartate racemase